MKLRVPSRLRPERLGEALRELWKEYDVCFAREDFLGPLNDLWKFEIATDPMSSGERAVTQSVVF